MHDDIGHRHGCGPRGHGSSSTFPKALFAMRGGRGWRGSLGPFHFDFGDGPPAARRRGRGRAAPADVRIAASCGWCCSS